MPGNIKTKGCQYNLSNQDFLNNNNRAVVASQLLSVMLTFELVHLDAPIPTKGHPQTRNRQLVRCCVGLYV